MRIHVGFRTESNFYSIVVRGGFKMVKNFKF